MSDRARGWNRRWDVLEPFLAHAAIQFPHSFDYVARVVAWRARRADELDATLWKDVTLSVACSAAELGHDSELVWALWLMKELNIKVTVRQIELFTRTSGPLVLALLAHMAVHGLTTRPAIIGDLQDRVAGEEQFSGCLWPLSLELHHLGHHARLDAHRRPGDEVIAAWHAAKASIIDWDGLPRVFERDGGGGDHDDDWEPDFAIEDYASAYDGEDEEDDEDSNRFGDVDYIDF